jgi:hypothetical protein
MERQRPRSPPRSLRRPLRASVAAVSAERIGSAPPSPARTYWAFSPQSREDVRGVRLTPPDDFAGFHRPAPRLLQGSRERQHLSASWIQPLEMWPAPAGRDQAAAEIRLARAEAAEQVAQARTEAVEQVAQARTEAVEQVAQARTEAAVLQAHAHVRAVRAEAALAEALERAARAEAALAVAAQVAQARTARDESSAAKPPAPAPAVAATAALSATAAQPVSEGTGERNWTIAAWIASTQSLVNVLGTAIKMGRPEDMSDLDWVKSLGMVTTPEEGRLGLHRMLSEAKFVDMLVSKLWDAIQNLRCASASTPWELHEKFQQMGAGSLSYSSLNAFFAGLEGIIGAPDPKVEQAMASEHMSEGGDRHEEFKTNNYGVTTTSATEWAFVATPDELPQDAWPSEKRLVAAYNQQRSPPFGKQNSLAQLVASGAKPRQVMPLDAMREKLVTPNERLVELKEPPIEMVEAVAARLYTGPMFVKCLATGLNMCMGGPAGGMTLCWNCDGRYNALLRGLHSEIASLKAAMVELCCSKIDAQEYASGALQFTDVRERLNLYTTTLHSINSSIVKLSKLTRATKVYRGIKGRVLPNEFWHVNEHGVRGGIEVAFMSTTTDRQVAMSYAANSSGEGSLILEIHQGMINRGVLDMERTLEFHKPACHAGNNWRSWWQADIAFLSQYPHEREIIFTPLSSLEVRSTYIEDTVLVVEVGVSINLSSLTMEQYAQHLKAS